MTTPIEPITPESDEEIRVQLAQKYAAISQAKKQRELEIPLIKKATAKMEQLAAMGCGASAAATAILRYCYRGRDSDTLTYIDLACLDTDNTESAVLLISTLARQKHTFPEEYLSGVARDLLNDQ